jgi:DNA-binding CsgD family transcriptional regulator
VEQVDQHLLQIIDYLEAFVAKYMLMFVTPVFIHFLVDSRNRGKKNAVFGAITLLAFSIHHYFEFVTESEKVEMTGDLIDRTLFFSIMIYALVLGVQKYRTIQDEDGKSTARKVLILIAVLLPGLLFDVYLNDYSHFRFFPLLYGGFSIIFILHFKKKYLRISAMDPPDGFDFDRHGISAREKEIILLILRGYSNQKIGKQLFISLNTVKSHVRHIFEKLNVQSRYELITAFKHRDIAPE